MTRRPPQKKIASDGRSALPILGTDCDQPARVQQDYTFTKNDIFWMGITLSIAKTAAHLGDVPVAAIIVKHNQIISTGFNRKEKTQSVTRHAEIIALEKACSKFQSWRLHDCDLYVSLEPCIMCAGAIYQSRIPRVTFGTHDPKGGALGSLYEIHNDQRLNHRLEVRSGLLQDQCSNQLKGFFRKRR